MFLQQHEMFHILLVRFSFTLESKYVECMVSQKKSRQQHLLSNIVKELNLATGFFAFFEHAQL